MTIKAKEYADRVRKEMQEGKEVPDIITRLFRDFIKESRDVVLERHISTDAGLEAVLHEFDLKWKALARELEKDTPISLVPDGFAVWVVNRMPQAAYMFKRLAK